MMTSTTDYIAGFKTVRHFGVVDVMSVNAVGAAGNIMGGIKALTGGKLDAYYELNDSTRKEAFDKMCDSAGKMGANAIIGVCIRTQGFEAGVLEVLCYGTAVLVEPL
ncbi:MULTISPECIES: YbjQ family protein [unclassified Coleofasciculus]|uniref:YbjQ family protein n=1 Tax=unclassified Coleofasciculus TaxID=2692782 RepID=UPI00187E4A16|nr:MULTISPECIES: heavy metal-binding domain-containing protein [unclassified Coleofasciculus]MBE9126334.1 heavy metal-binding domain-containing protein [Coleofasciculus sp. LEGE 07081]MBE9147489.1 heavy metal-binding domain-containing protein [Coleofasciculus sp. LEGE 07092]